MSDLTKCRGEACGRTCVLRESCWRYQAPASEHQSWFSPDERTLTGNCGYYWPRDAADTAGSKKGVNADAAENHM